MRRGFPALALGLTLLAAAASPARAAEAPADSSRWSWALGATVGIPQTIGLTFEKVLTPWARFQAHAGTVLLVTSIGGRIILLPTDRWVLQPYLFGGVGAFIAYGLEDFEGVVSYAWSGVGLRIALDRVVIYGELAGISDGDDQFGGPVPAVGIQFQFHRPDR